MDTFPSANWLVKGNAEKLAKTIRDYWGLQGYRVNVTVEQTPREGLLLNGEAPFQIRSDLINGLPRDYSSKGLDGGRLRYL